VMFGNPETTTGGNALKFYASVRMDIRRTQSIKTNAEVVGNRVKVRVTKNKVAPPFREAEFDIMFNEGISKVGDILDIGVNMDIITKRGAFFAYGDVKLGQGRENGKDFLRDHPEIANEIEAEIRSNVAKAAELAKASLHVKVEDEDEDEELDAVAIAEAVVEAVGEEE
jgi:recombination protein RecA